MWRKNLNKINFEVEIASPCATCQEAMGKSDSGSDAPDKISLSFSITERLMVDKGVELALEQIGKRRYDEKLRDDGIGKVLKYGIACYKKRCKAVLGE